MNKRWNILEVEESKVIDLHNTLKINPILCKILVQRGIESFADSKSYFRPQLDQLHSPWLMKDMDKAVSELRKRFNPMKKFWSMAIMMWMAPQR
ncbi:MAG TPA: hypothetical protein PK110_02415 [Niabella sp.]|nr:hypothetical protein [Niabella sp.]